MKKIFSGIFAISLFINITTQTSAADTPPFTDIAGSKYQTAIEFLYEEGVINGYEDGTFKPLQKLNRAELIKIVLGDNPNPDSNFDARCFPDVQEEWYAKYICYAKTQGWINGYPDGFFRPDQTINKVEALKIVANIYALEDSENTALPYTDLIDDAWYLPYMRAAYSRGLLEETTGKFSPGNEMNRGQISEIIYRILSGNNSCSASTTITGNIVNVKNSTELGNAIQQAKDKGGNMTILLADGQYNIEQAYWVNVDNLTIRSESGNRDKVIINGGGMNDGATNIFQLAGDNITIADMTLRDVQNHLIQVHGELDADNSVLHNLHLLNAYEQIVKVSYNADDMSQRSDSGILECSLLEYSAGIGPQYYIGGIDGHNTKDWTVRGNTFESIRSPEFATDPSGRIAEHAIHFWSDSEGTWVENNTIINSDRGIGFGLGDRGHHDGMITGNKIYHDSTRCDAGITLENSPYTVVTDNIVLLDCEYPNAIEYRFEGTKEAQIIGNKTNKAIQGRDGANAVVSGNTTVKTSDFKNPSQGDFTEK